MTLIVSFSVVSQIFCLISVEKTSGKMRDTTTQLFSTFSDHASKPRTQSLNVSLSASQPVFQKPVLLQQFVVCLNSQTIM